MTVCIVTVIACLANSYHKINEGHVGVYFKYGALQDRVNDPGVHFLLPFVEDYREVKIRPETFSVDPVVAITKDGIENTFEVGFGRFYFNCRFYNFILFFDFVVLRFFVIF